MENEKRLIDANALLEKVSRMIDYCKTDKKVNAVATLFQVGDAVMDCPTVDAVELVHGRWETTLVPDGYVQKASRFRKKCSVCGWTNACRYKYCPNCGAKMDGDGNG